MWAYDFVFDTCANRQTLKCLTVVDEWTRECLAIDVAGGIRSGRVIEVLAQLVSLHGGPRYLRSDNGPCYVSGELAEYLETHTMAHTRGAPYHPMTQGKIERYHRSMKNIVKLEQYSTPWELERAIAHFVDDDKHRRLHEALDNVTPADVSEGRRPAILARRGQITRRTLAQRKRENLHTPPPTGFALHVRCPTSG